jgi:peroxiredoxin
LADYRDRTGAFLQAGYRIIALSVDEPQRTEHLRQTLNLSFPILCDVQRKVVRDWDLFNPHEKGGIAVPATFVLDADRRVLLSSIDGVLRRAPAETVLAFVRGQATQPARRTLRPALLRKAMLRPSMLLALRNIFRYGFVSPRK